MVEQAQISKIVDHLFRREAGKMVAVLTKAFGLSHIELVEVIVQETLLTAFETWKLKGVPDNPQGWLYQVAKNRILTHLKREQNFQKNIALNKCTSKLRRLPMQLMSPLLPIATSACRPLPLLLAITSQLLCG